MIDVLEVGNCNLGMFIKVQCAARGRALGRARVRRGADALLMMFLIRLGYLPVFPLKPPA